MKPTFSMGISRYPQLNRTYQCVVLSFDTVAHPLPLSGFSASRFYSKQSPSSFCQQQVTPHHPGLNTPSTCPGIFHSASQMQTGASPHMSSCHLEEPNGSWVSGPNALRAVVLAGPGGVLSVRTEQEPHLSHATWSCGQLTSDRVVICLVLYGRWDNGQPALGLVVLVSADAACGA